LLLLLETDSNKASSGRFGMSSSSGEVFSFRFRPGPKTVSRLGVVPGFLSSLGGLGFKRGASGCSSSSCCCCC
jgi:hypothetical protein